MINQTFAGAEIQRPTGQCAATGRTLEPGEAIVTALVERQDDEALERRDYALDAWNEGARPGAPEAVFAFWRTRVPEPNAGRRTLIEDGELMDLFERLEGVEDDRQIAFRYVLALVLIRRRMLAYGGGEVADRVGGNPGFLRVRPKNPRAHAPPADAPTFTVTDPGMDEQMIAEATDQIGQIMDLDAVSDGGRQH